jgi:sortase A
VGQVAGIMTTTEVAPAQPAQPAEPIDTLGTPDAAPSTGLVARVRQRLGGPGERRTTERSAVAGVVVTVMALISLSAIWLLVYAVFFSGIQERSAQHRLYSSIRYSLAEELVPFGGQIKPGTPVALISAPGADITRTVVVEGTTSGVLRDGPGHQQNTALPGQAGVSVIMGRSVTFGGPFAHVASLQVGDPITVTTGQGIFTYRVTDVRVNGDPLPTTLPATGSRLTLVTSQGSGWRSGWAPSHQVFVDATLHGQIQAAPSGRPTVIAPAAMEMHGDTGGLISLVLWLQALLLLSGAVVWARLRWGFWQSWLVGAPAILAVVWLVSSDSMRLLPNLV